MRWFLRVLAVLVALLAPFLGTGIASAAVAEQGAIQVNGELRTYLLYRPAGTTNARRLPIVMMLHGGAGNGQMIARQTGLPEYVDQRQFIGVFPDSRGLQWHDGRNFNTSSRDDVEFLTALARDVVGRAGGDPARVFVAGASNGGLMVQRLACEAADIFTGYAIAIANLSHELAGSCRPRRRAPMIFFEGTADPTMPWAGGEITVADGRPVGMVLSVPQTIDFWTRANGCGAARPVDLPGRANDGTSVRVHEFDRCGVVLYEIRGGGHAWPGHARQPGRFALRAVGNVSYQIDATRVMLDFFRRYGL